MHGTTTGAAADDVRAEELYRSVTALQPRIAARAAAMQKAGRLDDDIIDALDDAGVFGTLVSRRWGGAGLGIREAGEIVRLLAQADVSTSWNASIYFATSLLVQRFPESVQAELFAERPSSRSAGLLVPSGKAERTEGGFRISGRWSYASGVYQSTTVLVPSICEGVPYWYMVPTGELVVLDDWDMSGISASGSATVVADNLFVPVERGMEMMRLAATSGHGGVALPEPLHRYPFARVGILSSAMPLGALQAGVALAREKLATSKPFGIARIERAEARQCWADAAQMLRMLQLLYDDAVAVTVERGARGHAWTLEEEGQITMDGVAIVHGAKDALRSLLDHIGGSSAYRNSDPLQRHVNDIGAMSTHLALGDRHVLTERAARWLLGMGRGPADPPI